ncbi:MAG: cyclase family protein [Clostridia bacterium]|nr:cyclase family protein [Clostridia bacterium]
MELRWLSYPMSRTAPRPPAIPEPRLTEFMSIEETGANVMFLQVYNHTGTHLDTAGHVFQDGTGICQFTPRDLTYTGIMAIHMTSLPDDTVVMPEHLKPFMESGSDAEALLVRFGLEGLRKNDPARFSGHCPGFGKEAAAYIHTRMPRLRMIGVDAPSIACIAHLDDTMIAHNEFFARAQTPAFIIIEEMKLDERLDGIRRILVSPWLFEGMNSGPCVIWAESES